MSHDRSCRRYRCRHPAGGLAAATLLVLLAASGCASRQVLPAFETDPRAADIAASDQRQRVGVCYSALFSTPEQVLAVARDSCPVDEPPQLVAQDMWLTCPLLTPVRATFACTETQR
jgi:hypothetical protein